MNQEIKYVVHPTFSADYPHDSIPPWMVCRSTRDPSGEPCWDWNVEYPPVAEFDTEQEANLDAYRRNVELYAESLVHVEREKLREAWPMGYLAIRGVSTIGGWICVPRGKELMELGFHSLSTVPVRDYTEFGCVGISIPPCGTIAADIIERGDLLPDLVDPATFFAVLCELVEALDLVPGLAVNDRLTGVAWKTNCGDDESGRGSEMLQWRLEAHTALGSVYVYPFNYSIDESNPIPALVHARTWVRKEMGR